MIPSDRIQWLNQNPFRNGRYVLYWMQASQRIYQNHALTYAGSLAKKRKKPLIVYFGISDAFPEANLRHFVFMLEGLQEVQQQLKQMNIPMIVRLECPAAGVVLLASAADAVVTDRGYLRVQKQWRQSAANELNCPLIQVESDVMVPVETVMQKEAWSAAVIRRRIHHWLDEYNVPCADVEASAVGQGLHEKMDSIDLSDIPAVLSQLNVDVSVPACPAYRGGHAEALRRLNAFVALKLPHYAAWHNHPGLDFQSGLSPYLHFGQISPLEIIAVVQQSGHSGRDAFLEQLIVRRELAVNFVHFNARYDVFDGLPDWALKTLKKHAGDIRPYLYSLDALEAADTHDVYWNAAQREIVQTGKMHGYMRMYWAKKILEWCQNPEDAYAHSLYLNNKYSIDGRDANGFAGVAWAFGKHDRPWAERAVFGAIRYMNANGLKRKFDMSKYTTLYPD